jgi:hypothetical protein
MNLEIIPLSPNLLDDYLNYFDNVAFTDHKDWSNCYCIHFHWNDMLENEAKILEKRLFGIRGWFGCRLV